MCILIFYINFLKGECKIAVQQTKFIFKGELIFPKESSSRPFVKKWKGGSDETLDMASINFGIKAGNSVGYVELFGMKSDIIYTMGEDNKKLEIPWDERNDAETIRSVANYKKIVLNIADERKEFITPYDAILYMEEHLKDISGKVKVQGTMEKEPYISKAGDKRYIDRFIIEKILPFIEEGSKPDKPGLIVDMDFYYNKKMLDKSELKTEQRVTVDGYVRQYLRSTKAINRVTNDAGQEIYLPQQAVLTVPKATLKDEIRMAAFKDKIQELTTASDEKLYHCQWACALISGAEEVEFDESQLTKKQKRQIELGESTLEDFKPKGNIFGPKVYELRLLKPILKGDFDNGTIEADDTYSEFEASIMKFKKPESFEEVAEAAVTTDAKSSSKKESSKDDVPFDLDDELNLDDLVDELGEDVFEN